jgi:flagellar biosynthesis GTPase FlhF
MGPKKAKKSKAELEEERLAREEEERKARAAEEKRLAEELQKKKQEEARIAAELKVIREADLKRWSEEYEDFVDDLKAKHQQLLAEEKSEVSWRHRVVSFFIHLFNLNVFLFHGFFTARTFRMVTI